MGRKGQVYTSVSTTAHTGWPGAASLGDDHSLGSGLGARLTPCTLACSAGSTSFTVFSTRTPPTRRKALRSGCVFAVSSRVRMTSLQVQCGDAVTLSGVSLNSPTYGRSFHPRSHDAHAAKVRRPVPSSAYTRPASVLLASPGSTSPSYSTHRCSSASASSSPSFCARLCSSCFRAWNSCASAAGLRGADGPGRACVCAEAMLC